MNEKSCGMTEQIMCFLDNSLDPSQAAEFRNHLKVCTACKKELHELRSAQNLLSGRERPPVPDTVLQSYERNLRDAFPVQTTWSRAKQYGHRMFGWRFKSSPYPQLAGAAVILIIGIVIGRFVLNPGVSDRTDMKTQADAVALQSDHELISQFLTQSEIWLLEVASAPLNGANSKLDRLTNREMATSLLAKTQFVERKAEDLNYQGLIVFLNRLEMILLETSGTRDEELGRAFEEIRLTIRETALLHELKRIRHSIRIHAGEET